jgi:hypothetical protein
MLCPLSIINLIQDFGNLLPIAVFCCGKWLAFIHWPAYHARRWVPLPFLLPFTATEKRPWFRFSEKLFSEKLFYLMGDSHNDLWDLSRRSKDTKPITEQLDKKFLCPIYFF